MSTVHLGEKKCVKHYVKEFFKEHQNMIIIVKNNLGPIAPTAIDFNLTLTLSKIKTQ